MDTIKAHDEALKTGGAIGIIDEIRVLSAIGRPYDHYLKQIYEKAAAFVEWVIQNDGFVVAISVKGLFGVTVNILR